MSVLSYAQVKKADREEPNFLKLEMEHNWIIKSQVSKLWELANQKGALNAYHKREMRQLVRALIFQLTE